MSTLILDGLSKHYGATAAVARMDLSVGHGELVALLGPSGCGKTTTLRMVAGFVEPSSGSIRIGGTDITRHPARARDTAMVFQSYALFPHMTVAQNVAFGLEMRKVPVGEHAARIGEALRKVRMERFQDRLPRQLSGGQQQRIALARALVVNPAVLLLDEPLSNLDAKLRAEVRTEIRLLQQELSLTTLIVTHDQEEALAMSDRLVVMDNGRVRQIGSAEDLYERPADTFVAGFVGRCNLIEGERHAGGFMARGTGVHLPCEAEGPREGQLALRPEKVRLGPATGGAMDATLRGLTYLGPQTECQVELHGQVLISIQPTAALPECVRSARRGDPVALDWLAADARVLPPASLH